MNMQATILPDDFTEENGETAVRPGSQIIADYPADTKEFFKNHKQITGKSGDVIIFVGLIQHCAMPNMSNSSRTRVLLQYLPKYIRPMEGMKRGVDKDVLGRATPEMRRLLTLDYPYPSILDETEAVNSEGYKCDFKWK